VKKVVAKEVKKEEPLDPQLPYVSKITDDIHIVATEKLD
jgi:hypothetical protein